jgi:hypothetical protein
MDSITYTTDKDARGRKVGTITARLGDAVGVGADRASAKDALLQMMARAVENRNARILYCGSGEALIVRFAYDAWTYSISRKDGRPFTASCHSASDYPTTLEQARAHALQSYGGVVFEQSL